MVIGENSLLIFLLEYLACAGFFKKNTPAKAEGFVGPDLR
jgi:hypothetical protein